MDLQTWRGNAACKNLTGEEADRIFFIKPGQSSTRAKLLCRGCPVRVPCLAFAIVHHEQGIWAGLTDDERYEIRDFAYTQVTTVAIETRVTSTWLPLSVFKHQIQQVEQQSHLIPQQADPLLELESPLDSLESQVERTVQDALKLAEELLMVL